LALRARGRGRVSRVGCTAETPERAAFARILLEHDAPPAGDGVRGTPRQRDASKDAETLGALGDGALLLRAQLRELGLQAIPLLSGTNGIALWVPLSDGPPYVALRGWLHTVSNEAVRRYPQRFSTEPNTHASGRIHLHVGTNAPGRYSALPYSLRGDDELRVCTPVTWDELASLRHGALAFNADSIGARLDMLGDVFARQLQEIPASSTFLRLRGRARRRCTASRSNRTVTSCRLPSPSFKTESHAMPRRFSTRRWPASSFPRERRRAAGTARVPRHARV